MRELTLPPTSVILSRHSISGTKNLPTHPTARLDKTVENLEKRLRIDPKNKSAVAKLVSILNFHSPKNAEIGSYTRCQLMLRSAIGPDFDFSDLLAANKTIEKFRQWQSLLTANGIGLPIAVAQLFTGQPHEIHGNRAQCKHRLELFNKSGAISRICHDCFKVQILPTTLTDLIRLYFVLRDMKLPRDNARKCMVELRENVPYPYKGYIYCQSEDEVKVCRDVLQNSLDRYGISDIVCGLSHGCSEYGLKYPSFKYSADGAHNEFERLEWWDHAERTFFATARVPKQTLPDRNMSGITIRDVLGFQTWLVYAEIIGDESAHHFREGPGGTRPEPFTDRVKAQAIMRREQLAELRTRLA